MDEPITVPLTEEPAIKTYDPDTGEEITESGNNFDKFMYFWAEIAKMDPEYFDASKKQEANIQARADSVERVRNYMRNIWRELSIMEILVSQFLRPRKEPVVGLQGTCLNEDSRDVDPDIPIGSVIIDKQHQLQDSSNTLRNSAAELREIIIPYKMKYHALCRIATRFVIHPVRNLLTDVGTHVLQKISSLDSDMDIVIETNRDGTSGMKLSHSSYFNLNGMSLYNQKMQTGKMKYSKLLSRIAMDAVFSTMTREMIRDSVDYEITRESKQFDMKVGDTKLHFSKTSRKLEPCDVCPVYIPALARTVVNPNPAPYKKLKACMEGLQHLRNSVDIVVDYFIGCDFVSVSHKQFNMSATIQIDRLYGTYTRQDVASYQAPIVVQVTKDAVYGNDPKSCMTLCVIKDLYQWCHDQYWSIFVDMVSSACARFGFDARWVGDKLCVTCEAGREVAFSIMKSHNQSAVIITVNEASQNLTLRWESIPVPGHYSRLTYLFFANFFT